jgi:hypothetical protein
MVTDNKIKSFAERLNKKLDAAGAPDWANGRQRWVAAFFKKEFKISEIGVRKWMMAEGMPDTKKLDAIATLLDTSVNYLLSGDDNSVKEPQPKYRPDRKDIHELIDRLPPRLLIKARAALEFFVVEDPVISQTKARKRS